MFFAGHGGLNMTVHDIEGVEMGPVSYTPQRHPIDNRLRIIEHTEPNSQNDSI